MCKYGLFKDMKYSEDHGQIKEWAPLLMNGRANFEKVAATRMEIGTDVNFGSITRSMFSYLQSCESVHLHLGHHVDDIDKTKDGWRLEMEKLDTGLKKEVTAKFVFIGAGGGALKLLEKTDIPQAEGYGGFPVSGQWLKCNNQEVINQHEAKVYGKASEGAPPMSVPHLDTRMMTGKKSQVNAYRLSRRIKKKVESLNLVLKS